MLILLENIPSNVLLAGLSIKAPKQEVAALANPRRGPTGSDNELPPEGPVLTRLAWMRPEHSVG